MAFVASNANLESKRSKCIFISLNNEYGNFWISKLISKQKHVDSKIGNIDKDFVECPILHCIHNSLFQAGIPSEAFGYVWNQKRQQYILKPLMDYQ